MSLKPKNLVEISWKESPFSMLPRVVNLYEGKTRRVKSLEVLKSLGFLFFILAFFAAPISSLVVAPTSNSVVSAQSSAGQSEERKALENQLKELEAQIDQYESTIQSYQKQGKTLKSEIDRLNANIAKVNLQIKAITLNIAQLDKNIEVTQNQIHKTEEEIDFTKSAIANILKNIYESETESVVEILIMNPKLSDFFGNINNAFSVKDSLRFSLQKVVSLRTDLLDEKERLAFQRQDAAALKAYQDSQRGTLQTTKSEKDSLLKVTKGQEVKYKDLLTTTQKTAAQIRNQIFRLLGGGELTFEKAYEFAKQAERATGVRAAFILAILDRESALGQNVGRCGYKDSMAPGPPKSSRDDVTPFLAIVSELGINPDSILVSCANADGAYGGAMGPAQFIPTTWVLYKDRVAQLTGSNPPSPWRNGDAFVAAGLYLQDAGAKNNEKIAAAKYYCGSNWNRYVCLNVYGQRVVENARGFQQDIDILNQNS